MTRQLTKLELFQVCVICILGICLTLACTSCATCDPAKYIERHCPVKYVEGDEADIIMRDKLYFDDRYCYVTEHCWWNANAISRWARAQGVPCATLPKAVKVGSKWITGGHVYVQPEGSAYYLDYVDSIGIVRYRK